MNPSSNNTKTYSPHGFVVGALISLSVGLFMLIQFWASLEPLDPNLAYCGMGSMPGFLVIFLGTPITAAIGSVIGSLYVRN